MSKKTDSKETSKEYTPLATIVMINGPAGTGKNHLAEQLRVKLSNGADNLAVVLEIKQPLIELLYTIGYGMAHFDNTPLTAEEIHTAYFADDSKDNKEIYAFLKERNYTGGLNGREIQIAIANAMRAKDPDVFMKGLWRRVHDSIGRRNKYILVPDWGLYDELNTLYYYVDNAEKDIKVVCVYLDRYGIVCNGDSYYQGGAQFKGDIRYCMRDVCHYTNPPVNELIRDLRTGEYAKVYDHRPMLASTTAHTS